MQQYSQAVIIFLAVINPVVCGVLLMQIGGVSSFKQRLFDATKAAVVILVILVLTALLGKYVLHAFGITIDAFKIVGGVIISFIGFGMFGGKAASDDDGGTHATTLSTLIMFAASPGTITTVIALSATHNAEGIPVTVLVGAAGAVFLTWLIMLLVVVGESHINKSVQQVFTRFMGLILISMGLQFILTGLKDFMGS